MLIVPTDVQAAPTITATPANSSVSLGDVYTLAMVDPGAIGDLSTPGPTRHWLVNGVTVVNGAVTVPSNATTITTYGGMFFSFQKKYTVSQSSS
jgi:hypothetical protein